MKRNIDNLAIRISETDVYVGTFTKAELVPLTNPSSKFNHRLDVTVAVQRGTINPSTTGNMTVQVAFNDGEEEAKWALYQFADACTALGLRGVTVDGVSLSSIDPLAIQLWNQHLQGREVAVAFVAGIDIGEDYDRRCLIPLERAQNMAGEKAQTVRDYCKRVHTRGRPAANKAKPKATKRQAEPETYTPPTDANDLPF